MSLGKTEDLIIILIIVLLLFGGKKIPQLARSIGQSAREIRKGFNEDEPATPAKSTTSSKTKSSK